ncbi:MAG: Txe/YoeB family addiction module toxin [Gammaproteobacteria bacterium]
MEVVYTKRANEDREYWIKNNPKILTRITQLIAAIKVTPFTGIGKSEPLRFEKTGYWSRRMDQEHRLVYKIAENTLYIAQCRYHY